MHELFQLEHIKPAVKEALRRKNLPMVQTSSPLVKMTTRDISGPDVKDNPIEDVVLEQKAKQLAPLQKQEFDLPAFNSSKSLSSMNMNQSYAEDFGAIAVTAAKSRVLDPLLVSVISPPNVQDLR